MTAQRENQRRDAATLGAESAAPGGAQRLQREVFDLHTVLDITRRFSAVLDTDALLDGMIMTAISHLGVGAAAVVIQRPGEDTSLTDCRWKGWTEVKTEDWTLDLQSGFAKVLSSLQQPVLFSELRPRLDARWRETELLERLGCEMVAPMLRRGRLRGVLYMSGRLNGHPFGAGDREFLALLVEQLSVSLENAILYESERRYAQELIQTQDRLTQSEKMATLGRLSAAIAHEINNPLGIIRNYLQIIRGSLPAANPATQSLAAISDEVDRMARIIRQLLQAFHPEASRPSAVDAGRSLREVIEFLRPDLERHRITVRIGALDDLPLVIAGDDPLRQVFMNLIFNARDVMPTGGSLSIQAAADAERVTMSFTDQGGGIDPENLPRVFEPFFSTKEAGHGSGLGLAICRGILEGFDASLEVSNAEVMPKGAVFTVCLRRVDAQGSIPRSLSAHGRSTATA